VYTAIVKYIVTSTTKTATKDGVLELEQEDEDDDVLEERQVVQSADPSDYILFIKNIKKTYSSLLSIGSAPKYAVRGINLTCAAGERFGKI
jgi:ABC-type glutathione transport system ATPase component